MDSTLIASRRGPPWTELLGAAALLGSCTAVAGLDGALVGLGTLVVWYVLGAPYAVAAGHVGLAAVLETITIFVVLLAEAGFVALLLVPVLRTPAPIRFAAITAGSALGLGLLGRAIIRAGYFRLAAVVMLGALGLAAYGLHRYELVRLGLVADAEATDEHTTEQL